MDLDAEYINIKDLRERSLVMLKDIKKFLKNNDIIFWIDFGTLLGAIREGRSIVWDGDYDLCLFDSDLIKSNINWGDLRRLGYNVFINQNNIKIVKNNWGIGYYKIDIHRIRKNSQGNYEYHYGELLPIYKKYIKILLNYLQAIQYDIPNFPEFDIITHTLLEEGIKPDELEDIGNIKFIKGKTNSPFDFTIVHDNFIIHRTFESKMSFKGILLFKIMKLLNKKCINLLINYLSNCLNKTPNKPFRKFIVPPKYYENLANYVEFHGLTFTTPNNPKEHLTRLFGNNWEIARVTHWRTKEEGAIGVE